MTSAAAEGSPRQRAASGWPALSKRFLADYRVPICATLMIVALVAAFSLPSQSAASFTTYLLAAYVLLGAVRWRGLFLDWGFLAVVALLIYIPLTSAWSTPFDARGALSQAIRAVLVFAFVVSFAECMQVDWFRRRMTLAVATAAALAALAALCVFFITPPVGCATERPRPVGHPRHGRHGLRHGRSLRRLVAARRLARRAAHRPLGGCGRNRGAHACRVPHRVENGDGPAAHSR